MKNFNRNSKRGILGLAMTLAIGVGLFAAMGLTAARADGDDWRYRDQDDHARYERERDHERRDHVRYEQERERRIEQDRRNHERFDREQRERERRDHERRERGHYDRDHRDHWSVELNFGNETHGERR